MRSTWEFSVLSLQFFYKSKFNPKFETIKDLRTRIIVTLRNTISMFNSIRAHPSPLLTTCVRQTQGPLPPVDMAGCTCAERHTGITLKCTALQTTPVHIWKESFVDQWLRNKNSGFGETQDTMQTFYHHLTCQAVTRKRWNTCFISVNFQELFHAAWLLTWLPGILCKQKVLT